MNPNEKTLRRLLWLRHGCPITALYGDDGEMSCGACRIDFKSYSAEQIERRWTDQALSSEAMARAIYKAVSKEIDARV